MLSVHVRAASPGDAAAMAVLLNEIISVGGTTAHTNPFSVDDIVSTFISPAKGISCFVAEEDAILLGFQALEWSDPNWPGEHVVPDDWAFIATYVSSGQRGKGIGRRLFAKTLSAAREAGVRCIDATIRRENQLGQAFYGGMGFEDYRHHEEAISKRFVVQE